MRTTNFLRGAALSLTLAVPFAAGFVAVTPAQAQIEDTIWRDQARIAAHVAPGATYNETSQVAKGPTAAPDQTSKVARGPSVTASDAGPALVSPTVGNDPQVNGAGIPISPRSGKELPGYYLGGF